jgi:hypothetical protein
VSPLGTGGAGNLYPRRRSTGDPYFQARMPTDCSCRMFREEPLVRPCVSLTEPSNNRPKTPLHEGSRDPALGNRAGFSFGR